MIARYIKNALLLLSGILAIFSLYLIFLWVPTESIGISQRIFYIHVSLAWVGFLAFFMVFIASIMYLITSKEKWDTLAEISGEIGVILTTLMLITGMIFAKAVWGVWWSWTPRLATSLILWFLYAGYVMLRAYTPDGSKGARVSAVMGIIAFIDVPIVYFSVQWWRDLHPGPTLARLDLPGSMLFTFIITLISFTVLFAYILMERYQLRAQEHSLERINQHHD